MFGLSNSLRVFLALEPVDLRMSFNGLYGVVLDRLEEDPCSGALFVFPMRAYSLIQNCLEKR